MSVPITYESAPQEVVEEVVDDAIEQAAAVVQIEIAEAKEEPRTTDSRDVRSYLIGILGEGHPLLNVARCESHYTQFNADGSVLRGVQNRLDTGVFQINEKYHLTASKKLGYDIYTLEGNVAYALYLYEHQGLTPWNWSKPCWG